MAYYYDFIFAYLPSCHRYIELNPACAAMVEDPTDYRWTSYRYNALGQSNQYLTPQALYIALGKHEKTRQAAHRSLFQQKP